MGYVYIFGVWVGLFLFSWFTVSWLLILERGGILICYFVLNVSQHVSTLNQSVVLPREDLFTRIQP